MFISLKIKHYLVRVYFGWQVSCMCVPCFQITVKNKLTNEKASKCIENTKAALSRFPELVLSPCSTAVIEGERVNPR